MTEAEAPQAAERQLSPPLSRREFLYYLWGISMVVFMAGSGGASIWFMLPRFREGEFGGVFTIQASEVPPADADPSEFPEGRFWLINLGQTSVADPRQPADYPQQAGVKAIYKVCTHLGCLYRWTTTNNRFECPCHGSKFLKSGSRVDGPARRNLDIFMIEALDASGQVVARSEPARNGGEGLAVALTADVVALRIDTGRRIRGAPNTQPGGGM
jgi:cytochrome b6-f complex iron-sulfur subunit